MSSFNQPTPVLSSSGGGVPRRQPGENDVVVGSNCSKHPGNLKFAQLIGAYKKARSRTNPRIEAAEAVKEVVAFWRNLSPRGRFLAQHKNSNDGQWYEVEEKQSMKIASFFLLKQRSGGETRSSMSSDAMRSSITSHVQSQGHDQLQGRFQSQGQGQCQQQVQQGQGNLQSRSQQQGQVQVKNQGRFQGQGQMQGQAQLQGQARLQGQAQLRGQMQDQLQRQLQGQGQLQGQRQLQGQGSHLQGQIQGQQQQGQQQHQFRNQGLTMNQQFQGTMPNLEPVPIGPSSSTSMGWNDAQKQHLQPIISQSFLTAIKSPVMVNSNQDCDPFDFNPIPLKFNDEDDFDPLPADFGRSSSKDSFGPIDFSTSTQVAHATDQVQFSVNMVVNTMPQGFQKETSVNTVTNIQIGTNTDERSPHFNDSISKPYNNDRFAGSNFQVGTQNGFIQISTQSNVQGNSQGSDAMQSGMSVAHNAHRASCSHLQMNEFQNAFFGGSDDGAMGLPDAAGSVMANGYQGNIQISALNAQTGRSSFSDTTGNARVQNNGLDMNKNKVGNAVPCAASLVGSLFDDW